MPLSYLLYRCPRCGQDPVKGEKDEVLCPACGTRYLRSGPGGLIRVIGPSGEVQEVPGYALRAAMEQWKDAAEPAPSGSPIHQAAVKVRKSGEESPVWWGGELLGFAESMGDSFPGRLELTEEALILRKSPGEGRGPEDGPGGGGSQRWPLLEIRAVQTSSSSLQISPPTGGLMEFRFSHDSPFRWETLLREALRRAYRREGRGEIIEFQPRIVAE